MFLKVMYYLKRIKIHKSISILGKRDLFYFFKLLECFNGHNKSIQMNFKIKPMHQRVRSSTEVRTPHSENTIRWQKAKLPLREWGRMYLREAGLWHWIIETHSASALNFLLPRPLLVVWDKRRIWSQTATVEICCVWNVEGP